MIVPKDAIRIGFSQWVIYPIRRKTLKSVFCEDYGWKAIPVYNKVKIRVLDPEARSLWASGAIPFNEYKRRDSGEIKYINLSPIETTDMVSQEEWGFSISSLFRRIALIRSCFANSIIHEVSMLGVCSNLTKIVFQNIIEERCTKVAKEFDIFKYSEPKADFIHDVEVGTENKDMVFDLTDKSSPEFVAYNLADTVLEEKEKKELDENNFITLYTKDFIYRIYRKVHKTISVWDSKTFKPVSDLCIVFNDMGKTFPPSDELIMKYVLAKHDPKTLWKTANKLGFSGGNI